MKKMDVSIIIINYNTYELTCSCIDSVIKKTKGVYYEIILVDNASTEKIDGPSFEEKFPHITFVQSNVNLGFAKGNNLGIEYSRGRNILLLNSDTYLNNNAIQIVSDYIDNDSEVGLATCKLIYENGMHQKNCKRIPSISLEVIELLRLHKLFSKKRRGTLLFGSYFDYNSIAYPEMVWGAFFMFPKKLLKDFPEKKLHETFFMYGEDMEWSYFINKILNKKVLFIPEGIVTHYIGASGFKSGNNKIIMFYGDKAETIIKHRKIFMKKYKSTFYSFIFFLLRSMNIFFGKGDWNDKLALIKLHWKHGSNLE